MELEAMIQARKQEAIDKKIREKAATILHNAPDRECGDHWQRSSIRGLRISARSIMKLEMVLCIVLTLALEPMVK